MFRPTPVPATARTLARTAHFRDAGVRADCGQPDQPGAPLLHQQSCSGCRAHRTCHQGALGAWRNRVHWCMDVILVTIRCGSEPGMLPTTWPFSSNFTLNLIRLDPVKRKGGIKARRLIAATSDDYRAELLGLR